MHEEIKSRSNSGNAGCHSVQNSFSSRLLPAYILKYLIPSLCRFGLFSGHGVPDNEGSWRLRFRRWTQLHSQPPL